jgi:hypothetical protein
LGQAVEIVMFIENSTRKAHFGAKIEWNLGYKDDSVIARVRLQWTEFNKSVNLNFFEDLGLNPSNSLSDNLFKTCNSPT